MLGLLADDVVTRCVLVVRGDHVGRLAEHPDLAPLLHGALVMVPPMTETELRQVVEEPARVAGLAVEADLTDVAVRDVLGRSGALPLLSTALAETWERRRDGTLTLAGYLATGGVTGAVGRSAETAFASLPTSPGRSWPAGSWCGSPSRTSKGRCVPGSCRPPSSRSSAPTRP